jgi:hypothetical protein
MLKCICPIFHYCLNKSVVAGKALLRKYCLGGAGQKKLSVGRKENKAYQDAE